VTAYAIGSKLSGDSRIERGVAVETIFKKKYPAFTVIERLIKETY
jgi:hypothetical protein